MEQRLWFKIIGVAIYAFFSLPAICHAANAFVPIEDWQVMQRKSAKTGTTDCIAHTRQSSNPVSLIFGFNIVMNSVGDISFEVATPQRASWMYYGPEVSAEELTAYRQEEAGFFWLDSGSKKSMAKTFEGASMVETTVPQNSSGLAAELSRAVYLNLQGADSDSLFTYYMPNMGGVVPELEACRSNSQRGAAYNEVAVASFEPSISPLYEPIKVRLEKAATIINQQREKGSGWRSELLAAGEAALDALRLQDAYAALWPAVAAAKGGAAKPSDVQRGLEKLVEVLILLERFDEARSVANLHPHNARFLGAIAQAEGLEDEASKYFSLAAQEIAGDRLTYMDLSVDLRRGKRIDVADLQAAEMRNVLFLWGLGASGQDVYFSDARCGNREVPIEAASPAFFASQVFEWRDHAMLHRRGGNNPVHRRELGLAAYMRGVSMQSGGCLQSAKTDLSYALYELKDGSGADGWALMAELALLRQLDATGQIMVAQNGVKALQRRVESEVGKDSLPWLLTGAFILELAGRAGEVSKYMSQADEIIGVAMQNLPPLHSFRIRLARIIASGLVKENAPEKAVQTVAQVMGATASPRLSKAQFKTANDIVTSINNSAGFDGTAQDANKLWSVERLIVRNAKLNNMVGLTGLAQTLSPVTLNEYAFLASVLRDIAAHKPDSDEERYSLLLSTLLEYRGKDVDLSGSDSFSFKNTLMQYAHLQNLPEGGKLPSEKENLLTSLMTILWLYSVHDRISIASLFPSYNRDVLIPGTDMKGMSRLLNRVTHLKNDLNNFDLFIKTIQAADKSYALGALLTRAQLVEKGDNPERQLESRRALEGDLYLRRQRGLLHAMLLQPEREKQSARAAIREKYQMLRVDSSALVAKFETILSANSASFEETFNLRTWHGATEYAFDTEKAKACLAPAQAMVVWYPLEDETYVAIVRQGSAQWRMLPVGQVRLARRVSAINGNIKQVSQEIGQQLRPFPVKDAAALYQALVAPLEDDLKGIDHIFTVQLGAVSNIPLGLLVTNATDTSTPKWLIDRFAITRMPALLNAENVEKYRPKREVGRELLFAAGAPVIEGKTDVVARADIEDAARHTTLGQLEDIPNAVQMMENIAKTLGTNTKNMLVGRNMNKASVLRALRQHTYKYLLLVTHGLVGGSTVGEPALYLSPPTGKNSQDDGLLRASEVVALNLDTDLALLTACKTSVADDDGSEPLAGLASAFLVAGARSVLASHWEVDSAAAETISTKTVSLMHDKKMEPAKALQLVMQGMNKKMDMDSLEGHPYYWAAFEVIGFPTKK